MGALHSGTLQGWSTGISCECWSPPGCRMNLESLSGFTFRVPLCEDSEIKIDRSFCLAYESPVWDSVFRHSWVGWHPNSRSWWEKAAKIATMGAWFELSPVQSQGARRATSTDNHSSSSHQLSIAHRFAGMWSMFWHHHEDRNVGHYIWALNDLNNLAVKDHVDIRQCGSY